MNAMKTTCFFLALFTLSLSLYYTDPICKNCTNNCDIRYIPADFDGKINVTSTQVNDHLDAYLTDLEVYVSVSHKYPEDLDTQISFGGSTVILFHDQEGTGSPDVRSHFNASGRDNGGCMSCGDTMKPDGNFDVFLNKPILSNTFHLNIADYFVQDDGVLRSWCVTLSYDYPTNNPTHTFHPSQNSDVPSMNPSFVPSNTPTLVPSTVPTLLPSFMPSYIPTYTPSFFPSRFPSVQPTRPPSELPSSVPSVFPSDTPTLEPTPLPSRHPTRSPTTSPSSISPTKSPTESWNTVFEFELDIECTTSLRADIAFSDYRIMFLEPIEETYLNLTDNLLKLRQDFRVHLRSIGPYGPIYDVHTRRRVLQTAEEVWNYTLRFDIQFIDDSKRILAEELSQTSVFLEHLMPLYKTTFNDDNLVLVLQSPSERTTTLMPSTTDDNSSGKENKNNGSEEGVYIGVLVGLVVFCSIIGGIWYLKSEQAKTKPQKEQMDQVVVMDTSIREPTMLTNQEMTDNESRIFKGSIINPRASSYTKGQVQLVDTPSLELQPRRGTQGGGQPIFKLKLLEVVSSTMTPGGPSTTNGEELSDSEFSEDSVEPKTTTGGQNTVNITLPKAPLAPITPVTRGNYSSDSDSDLDVLNTTTPDEEIEEEVVIKI